MRGPHPWCVHTHPFPHADMLLRGPDVVVMQEARVHKALSADTGLLLVARKAADMMKRMPTDSFAPRHVYRLVKTIIDWSTMDVAKQWFDNNKDEWVWLVAWLKDASYLGSLGGSRVSLTRQQSKDVTLRQLRTLAGQPADDASTPQAEANAQDGGASPAAAGGRSSSPAPPGQNSAGGGGGSGVSRMDVLAEEADEGEPAAGRPPLGSHGRPLPVVRGAAGRSFSSDGEESIPEDLPDAAGRLDYV